MRERSAGISKSVVDIRSGGSSFVMKRMRICRDGESSMVARGKWAEHGVVSRHLYC
jgi:hypothetical protein